MYLAFYKKPKTIFEKIIKFFTKSDYVHCEVASVKLSNSFYGYSSEPFVGVRSKWIDYTSDEWDFLPLPKEFNAETLKAFYDKTKHSKYDYLGVLGFVFGTKHNPKRWFCSEWCSEYLGIKESYKITPHVLYNIAKDLK